MFKNSDTVFKILGLFKDYNLKNHISSYQTFQKIITNHDNVFILNKEMINNKISNNAIQDTQVKESEINTKQTPMPKKIVKEKKNNDEFINQIEKLKLDAINLNSLEEINEYLKKSSFCDIKQLSQNTVMSDGIENAKIILIGEAPGEEEDAQGIPFCGRSGKLLDNILKSINLDRKINIYITNTVYWRPPANRRPTDEEIDKCRPFLFRIIELIKPDFLILCGATAIQSVLQENDTKIGDIHGKIIDININGRKIKASGIYHPSYLLRSPSSKKTAWFDMIEIAKNLI